MKDISAHDPLQAIGLDESSLGDKRSVLCDDIVDEGYVDMGNVVNVNFDIIGLVEVDSGNQSSGFFASHALLSNRSHGARSIDRQSMFVQGAANCRIGRLVTSSGLSFSRRSYHV